MCLGLVEEKNTPTHNNRNITSTGAHVELIFRWHNQSKSIRLLFIIHDMNRFDCCNGRCRVCQHCTGKYRRLSKNLSTCCNERFLGFEQKNIIFFHTQQESVAKIVVSHSAKHNKQWRTPRTHVELCTFEMQKKNEIYPLRWWASPPTLLLFGIHVEKTNIVGGKRDQGMMAKYDWHVRCACVFSFRVYFSYSFRHILIGYEPEWKSTYLIIMIYHYGVSTQ